jgi:hypothetical protein
MRILIGAMALASALILAGCAGTNFSYDEARKVQVGMTEDQVVSIMGPPYSVVARDGAQMWVWSHANGMTGASRAVSFKMKDGKVAEIPTIPASFK